MKEKNYGRTYIGRFTWWNSYEILLNGIYPPIITSNYRKLSPFIRKYVKDVGCSGIFLVWYFDNQILIK